MMSNNNINLLPKKRVARDSQEGVLRILKRIAFGFGFVTVGSSVGLFLLTINPSFSNVKQQENTVLANLSFTKGKIAKYLVIKDRLRGIGQIIKSRYPMDT